MTEAQAGLPRGRTTFVSPWPRVTRAARYLVRCVRAGETSSAYYPAISVPYVIAVRLAGALPRGISAARIRP